MRFGRYELVCLAAQSVSPIGGGNRYGEHNDPRTERPRHTTRGGRRRACRDTVVDDHGRLPHEIQAGSTGTEQDRPSLKLLALRTLNGHQPVDIQAHAPHRGLVDDPHPILAESSDGVLGLARSAEFSDDDDVERGMERIRNDGGDRHATAREAEDDRVAQSQPGDHGRESLSRVPTVVESHVALDS